MKTMKLIALLGIIALFTAGSALAQVALPHTFSAGTAASAAEVNANFQALANSTHPSMPGGYGQPFSSNGTLAGRNVVVLSSFNGAVWRYMVRMRYANTISENVVVAGAPTQPAYIALYVIVQTDADGVTVQSVNSTIESMADTTYTLWNMEGATYLTDGTGKTVVNSDVQGLRMCNSAALQDSLWVCPTIYRHPTTGELNYLGSDATRTMSVHTEPVLINGMTFSDYRVENFLRMERTRIRAKGIGVVHDWRPQDGWNFKAIWYRTEGNTPVGNLTGTPFAAAGALNGVFFTP